MPRNSLWVCFLCHVVVVFYFFLFKYALNIEDDAFVRFPSLLDFYLFIYLFQYYVDNILTEMDMIPKGILHWR